MLVVDDDDDICAVAKASLEAVGGFEVLTAASGSDALPMAARERPDAILLDVMMPGMDGPTVLERLRADEATREIPVLFLTAKAQAAEQARLRGLRVAGVLTKPFDPMQLSAHLAAALGWER